jgi:hypothetical protein
MTQDEGGPAGPELRSAVAATLVVIGALLLLIGWWWEESAGDGGLPPVAGERLGVLVALLCVLVAMARRRESSLWAERTATRRVVTTGLAVAAALGVTAFHVVDGLRRYGDGYPGVVAPLGVIGGVAVTAGLLFGATRPAEGRWRRWNGRRLAAVSCVAVALAAVCVPVALTSDSWAIRSSTASAAAIPPTPGTVSKVAWTSPPMPGRIEEVHRAGAGAVVLLEDGVVGVDGLSGAIRWSYRRLGAQTGWMLTSPDGGAVVLGMLSEEDWDVDTMLILDAVTGVVRFSGRYPDDLSRPAHDEITNDVLVTRGRWDSDGEFRAFSLRDGSVAWTWRWPDGCRTDGLDAVAALGRRVIAPVKCGDEARFIVLDGATGRQVGEHTVAVAPQSGFPRVISAPDGSLALLDAYETVRPELRSQLLDVASDKILPMPARLGRLLPNGLAMAGEGKERVVLDARTGVPRYPDAIGRCEATGVLLENMVLCLRRGDDWLRRFVDTGEAVLSLIPLATQQAGDLAVGLGPRAMKGIDRPLELVAANGAVIAYSTIESLDGAGGVLVGLQ